MTITRQYMIKNQLMCVSWITYKSQGEDRGYDTNADGKEVRMEESGRQTVEQRVKGQKGHEFGGVGTDEMVNPWNWSRKEAQH